MKSPATTTAVETSSTPAVPSSMLSQRHLRQPPKRKHRHNNKSNSYQNSLFHITTLGSRTPQSLDVRQPPKDSNQNFTPAQALRKCSGRLPRRALLPSSLFTPASEM
jgi:hypothetical protein